MTTFPGSPKVLKGGLVLIDADTAPGAAHHLAAVQPGLRHPHAAGPGRGRGGRAAFGAPALQGTGGRDDQARRRDRRHRPARIPRSEPRGGGERHPAAARGSGVPGQSDQRPAAAGRFRGELRHAGDRAHAGAPHPLRLGQEPDRAGARSPTSPSPRKPSIRRSTRSAPRSASAFACCRSTTSASRARAAACS